MTTKRKAFQCARLANRDLRPVEHAYIGGLDGALFIAAMDSANIQVVIYDDKDLQNLLDAVLGTINDNRRLKRLPLLKVK